MKKRVASLVLVSAMGVGGVTSLAITPALAAESTAVSQRLTDIKNALKGLVSDGTITQAQADKVATTLDQALPKGRPGGHGGRGGGMRGLADAATVLGMSEADLRAALQGGASLAEIASGKGISKATLIDKLVAAAKTRIAADVKAGRITQAHADQHLADLKTRITELVDREGLPARPARPTDTTPSSAGTSST